MFPNITLRPLESNFLRVNWFSLHKEDFVARALLLQTLLKDLTLVLFQNTTSTCHFDTVAKNRLLIPILILGKLMMYGLARELKFSYFKLLRLN